MQIQMQIKCSQWESILFGSLHYRWDWAENMFFFCWFILVKKLQRQKSVSVQLKQMLKGTSWNIYIRVKFQLLFCFLTVNALVLCVELTKDTLAWLYSVKKMHCHLCTLAISLVFRAFHFYHEWSSEQLPTLSKYTVEKIFIIWLADCVHCTYFPF